MSRLPLVFLIGVIIISVIVPVLVLSQGIFFPMEVADLMPAAGKLLGLIGFFVLSFQYLWTAKLKVFERLRSYDSRVAVHRTLGFLAILIITLHPVLILAGYAAWGMGLSITMPIASGFLALILLLLIAGSTFLSRIWGVHYDVWKRLHWLTFPVLTLVFLHSVILGGDIYGAARYLWFALWGLHLLILLSKAVHKVRAWSRTNRVLTVSTPVPGITSLTLERPKGNYLPGQFVFISLKTGGRWRTWHPFSLTSNPSEDTLAMTIKGLGDFSNRVSDVEPGDPIKIDAAYGAFSSQIHTDSRYVLIAGGVGITPIYGILKDLKERSGASPEVILLYCVHHESDILFRDDLDRWFAEKPNWRLFYICSSQPDWKGEKGRLTPEKALSLVGGSLEGTFFLCGPTAMVSSMVAFLRLRGVPKRKIRREQFVFLP